MNRLLNFYDVVLFLQTRPGEPVDPFAARVVSLLRFLEVDFVEIDVEHDPEIGRLVLERDECRGLPQLFVRGNAIGNCDAVTQMVIDGGFTKLLADERVVYSEEAERSLAAASR